MNSDRFNNLVTNENFRLPISFRVLRNNKVPNFLRITFSSTAYYSFWVFLITLCLLSGCRSSSISSIPDAPPPYPSFPFPQERYNSAQVYGGQNMATPYIPPYSPSNTTLNTESTPTFYTPPPAPPNQQGVAQQPVQLYAFNSNDITAQLPRRHLITL